MTRAQRKLGSKQAPDHAGLIDHVKEKLILYLWEANERILGK